MTSHYPVIVLSRYPLILYVLSMETQNFLNKRYGNVALQAIPSEHPSRSHDASTIAYACSINLLHDLSSSRPLRIFSLQPFESYFPSNSFRSKERRIGISSRWNRPRRQRRSGIAVRSSEGEERFRRGYGRIRRGSTRYVVLWDRSVQQPRFVEKFRLQVRTDVTSPQADNLRKVEQEKTHDQRER